jgi:hypothetical protein
MCYYDMLDPLLVAHYYAGPPAFSLTPERVLSAIVTVMQQCSQRTFGWRAYVRALAATRCVCVFAHGATAMTMRAQCALNVAVYAVLKTSIFATTAPMRRLAMIHRNKLYMGVVVWCV